MVPQQRVFVDANVFVSRALRDWLCLLRLETDGMFQLHTTEDVLAEVVYTLRRRFPEREGAATTRLRSAILGSIDELVEDFDPKTPYSGPDPDDRHVHAAAVAAKADVLLTEDHGFDEMDTDALPYEVSACDDFFVLVDDSAPHLVRQVTQRQQQYWAGRPAAERKPLVAALRDAGCPEFALRVEHHLRVLSGLPRAQRRPEPRVQRP